MGFYGNLANVARTTFSFDKTYSTHFEMVLKEASDQVFVGRYALLDYDYKDEKDDGVYKLVQIVEWLRTNHLGADWEIVKKSGDVWEEIAFNPDTSATQNKSIDHLIDGNYYIVVDGDGSFESPLLYRCDGETKTQIKFGDGDNEAPLPESISNWYKSHYQIDEKIFDAVGRGWDSTVWQKTYKGNNLAYVMIAELNGVVPTIDILNDPPIWLEGIGNNNSDLINGEYTYRTTKKYMAPYFDEEDKTNLYYRLHVQSPWKFGIGEITGLPEKKGDAISLSYTKSEKDDYSYGVGKTGTAVDTIKFNFALPSIGNALKTINTLLYGSEDGNKNIDPAKHNNSESNVNKICYFISESGDLNPDAFKSIAGVLNTTYDILGDNITSTPGKDSTNNNVFPEGFIYYAKYSDLIGLSDVNSDYVNTEGVDTDSDKKYCWYQYNDIDNYVSKKKYKALGEYPSYNKILLALGQQVANAEDFVDDLQNLVNEKVGVPGSLMFTDSDYRTGGVSLIGDDVINISDPIYAMQRNYLPYPNWSMKDENDVKVYGKKIENGLTFTIDDKNKTFTIQGTATAYTEEIIATNVYLPRGDYLFMGIPAEAESQCSLKAIRGIDGENSDDYTLVTGEMSITVSSDDFYFDVIKICVKKDTSFEEAVEFTPMIKIMSDTDTSTEYVPYQNEYEINIKHKQAEGPITSPKYENKTDEDGNSITVLANNTIYAPTVDEYGHIEKMESTEIPNYYSKILLRNESPSQVLSEIALIPDKVGRLLDLTQIDGMNFRTEKEDNETKILFRPTVDVNYIESEPIFQTEEPNINNESKWRRFPIVSGIEFSQELNSLDVRARQIPFPVSHISIASRPTLTQEGENGQQVVTPIEFNWGSTTNPGLTGTTGIYEPEYRAYTDTATNTTLPTRILTFSPADNIIKLGIWQDGSQIDPTNIADARRIIIGHGKPLDLQNKQSYIIGEVNNLISRQEARIPDIINSRTSETGESLGQFKTTKEILQYSDPITEKVNLTTEDNSNGIFSTLSLQVDKTGHIIDMKQINVKLIIDSLIRGFLNPKGISPFVTYFYHNRPLANPSDRSTMTVEEQSLIYNYGAYCVGDRIYLNEGESIDNYVFIGIRAGILNASPSGSGASFHWIPSSTLKKGSNNTHRITITHNRDVYGITFFWSIDKTNNREYIEVVGNTSIYSHYNNSNYREPNSIDAAPGSTFQMRSTSGIRQYARSGVCYSRVAPGSDGTFDSTLENQNVRMECTFAAIDCDNFGITNSDPETYIKSWKRYTRAWNSTLGKFVYTKDMKSSNEQYTLWDYLWWIRENNGKTYHPWKRKVNPDNSSRKLNSMYKDPDPNDKEFYLFSDSDNWYDADGSVRAVANPRWVGIRQILGLGLANTATSADIDIPTYDPPVEEDENGDPITSESSSSEQTWVSDGSGNGNGE